LLKKLNGRLRGAFLSADFGGRAVLVYAEQLESRMLLSGTMGHDLAPAAVAADAIELDINTVTGDVELNANNASDVTLVSLASAGGGLVGNTSFTSAFDALLGSTASNSDSSIVAFNTTPQAMNGLIDMGDIYDTGLNTGDVTFQFSERGVNRGAVQTGTVVYLGGTVLPAPVASGPGSSSSPGTVLSTMTPTFQWSAVTGVSGLSGYQINLTDSTAERSFTYTVGASATSFALPSGVLVNGDQYQWNVQAMTASQTGPASGTLYFQAPAAVAPPVAPAPVALGPGTSAAPGSVLSTLTPVFQWRAVSGVSGLQLSGGLDGDEFHASGGRFGSGG
jgi:hypothetical protein